MANRKFLGEVLDEAEATGDTASAIRVLQGYAKDPVLGKGLMLFFQALYHPAVVMDLPPGIPAYRAATNIYGYAPANLIGALDAVKMFVKSAQKTYVANGMKRQQVFLRLLETMHQRESELFVMLKEKKLTGFKTLNWQLFARAFPAWFGTLPQPSFDEKKTKPVVPHTEDVKVVDESVSSDLLAPNTMSLDDQLAAAAAAEAAQKEAKKKLVKTVQKPESKAEKVVDETVQKKKDGTPKKKPGPKPKKAETTV